MTVPEEKLASFVLGYIYGSGIQHKIPDPMIDMLIAAYNKRAISQKDADDALREMAAKALERRIETISERIRLQAKLFNNPEELLSKCFMMFEEIRSEIRFYERIKQDGFSAFAKDGKREAEVEAESVKG